MVFSIFYFPYARQEGKAKVYMQGVNQKIFLWASGISLLIIFFSAQFKGMIIWLIITAAAYLINRFIKDKIDGLTGDTLGALCEIIEVMVLFSLTLLNYKI